MQTIFNLIGKGCDVCLMKPKSCPTCERNPNLLKLKDNFKKLLKKDMKLPALPPGVADEGAQTSQDNASELGAWGFHPPVRPTPPDKQKPKG